MSGPSGRVIAIALSLVMGLVVGIGIYFSGSPGTTRQEALDAHRVRDLRDVKGAVNTYWKGHRMLPSSIDGSSAVPADSIALYDPVTGAPYEYRVTSDSTYELCAVFAHPSPEGEDPDWRHPAGRHCFPLRPTGGTDAG